jgi:hypothetical protein
MSPSSAPHFWFPAGTTHTLVDPVCQSFASLFLASVNMAKEALTTSTGLWPPQIPPATGRASPNAEETSDLWRGLEISAPSSFALWRWSGWKLSAVIRRDEPLACPPCRDGHEGNVECLSSSGADQSCRSSGFLHTHPITIFLVRSSAPVGSKYLGWSQDNRLLQRRLVKRPRYRWVSALPQTLPKALEDGTEHSRNAWNTCIHPFGTLQQGPSTIPGTGSFIQIHSGQNRQVVLCCPSLAEFTPGLAFLLTVTARKHGQIWPSPPV